MAHLSPATPRGRLPRQRTYRRNLETVCADTALSNLLAVFDRSDRTGADWYPEAHDTCAGLAREYGLTTEQTTGVVAALSPQTGWARNLVLARELIETGDTAHYDDAKAKARAILAGAAPFDVLGGPKVRSFHPNLLHPHRPGPVTCDRHHWSVLTGAPVYASDRTLELRGLYTFATGVTRTAARRIGLLPHVLQSIVWVQWRSETGADRHDAYAPPF